MYDVLKAKNQLKLQSCIIIEYHVYIIYVYHIRFYFVVLYHVTVMQNTIRTYMYIQSLFPISHLPAATFYGDADTSW